MNFLSNLGIGIGSGSSQLSSRLSSEEATFSDYGAGKREDKQVEYGYAALQGRRGSMEDCVAAQFKRCSNGEIFGFFGVFDGHGGHHAAEFVKRNLFAKLERDPHFPNNMETALQGVFEQTDQAYLDGASEFRDDGCTGVAAVIRGRHLWIAHVGDSRAVLCTSSGKVIALSEDHKPNRESERKRIEGEGGVVIWAGTWRVGGVLAVSRAFGDRQLKKFVIARPDVRYELVDPGEESVILASDGLWDVVSNKEAADLVRKAKDVKLAAKSLADEALHRGSTDNISCVVIRFA